MISRKRKTKSRAWTILIFAAVCASICLGIWYIGENSSSKKRVDIKEYFGVNAEEIAIIYNYSVSL